MKYLYIFGHQQRASDISNEQDATFIHTVVSKLVYEWISKIKINKLTVLYNYRNED